jgi:hypothetical protein
MLIGQKPGESLGIVEDWNNGVKTTKYFIIIGTMELFIKALL